MKLSKIASIVFSSLHKQGSQSELRKYESGMKNPKRIIKSLEFAK